MGLVLRPLEGAADYAACVALQRRTWGESFAEVVPPSLLMVTQEMGGIASGAFDGDRLVGFVFGISGLRDGRPAHWSDMLAVEPAHQGRGVGRLLKLHQRERLLALGIDRVLWTFDPLVARNAHLNLNRLGAIARTYRRNAYGESDSPLHAGIGTDRLLAEWELDSARVHRRIAGADPGAATEEGPLVAPPEPGDPFPRPGGLRPEPGAPRVRVAIPADIQALKAADPALAGAWRRSVREGLEWAFGAGYVAVALGGATDGVAAYTLTRGF
ncbi:MAG TPA: GNAT family N-acetyltransferase [Longimicrobiales bacterium]|nr:GNAT family N-acetyltransferase [Longimicrobiales bacterium]